MTAQSFGGSLGVRLDAPKTTCPKMPKIVNPLTDIQIRNAKPKDKPYKLADGGGLYVEVMMSLIPYFLMEHY